MFSGGTKDSPGAGGGRGLTVCVQLLHKPRPRSSCDSGCRRPRDVVPSGVCKVLLKLPPPSSSLLLPKAHSLFSWVGALANFMQQTTVSHGAHRPLARARVLDIFDDAN